jgi:hypothetical protein
MRAIPNPKSEILAHAVITRAGIGTFPPLDVPENMGVVVLFVPIQLIAGKTPVDIQNDIGFPWYAVNGPSAWFDDLIKPTTQA